MNINLYSLQCITNLHVGSGDVNFNIIDNEVEKDPITGYPIIFSSGVKGALRAHFTGLNAEEIEKIFGPKADNKEQSVPGVLKFLEANLLALPMRASKGKRAYYMVTTLELLQKFIQLKEIKEREDKGLKKIKEQLNKIDLKQSYKLCNESIAVEGIEVKKVMEESSYKELRELLIKNIGENVVIIPDEEFRTVSLPVMSRNCLENGKSTNLWYEEIVPHESIFYFCVLSNGTAEGDMVLEQFNKTLQKSSLVQFGGNATIGYGLSLVKEIQ